MGGGGKKPQTPSYTPPAAPSVPTIDQAALEREAREKKETAEREERRKKAILQSGRKSTILAGENEQKGYLG